VAPATFPVIVAQVTLINPSNGEFFVDVSSNLLDLDLLRLQTSLDAADLLAFIDVTDDSSNKITFANLQLAITTIGTVTVGNVDAILSSASTTTPGISELTTIAEVDTGTDTTRSITSDALQGSIRNVRFPDWWIVDVTTDVTTGTTKHEWRAPFDGTIVQDDSDPNFLMAWNATAGSTGTMVVDIHKNGTSIMTTNKIDIETGEKTSADAATQPDLTTTTFVAGDIFTIDVDAIHSTAAKGLWVRMAVRLN